MRDTGPFIKVLIGFPHHWKTAELSDKAYRHLVNAWCFCADHKTDGFITLAQAKGLFTARTTAELLVNFMHTTDDGRYRMHDYLDIQTSRAEMDALGSKRAAAGKAGGTARANRLASASPVAKQNASKTQAEVRSKKLEEEELPTTYVSEETYVSSDPENERRSKPVRADAARLARIYCDQVKLSNRGHVATTIGIALAVGYRPDQIEPALNRLADHGMSVTENTLRIEIDGRPPVLNGARSTTDDRVASTLALAQRYAAEDAANPRMEIGR